MTTIERKRINALINYYTYLKSRKRLYEMGYLKLWRSDVLCMRSTLEIFENAFDADIEFRKSLNATIKGSLAVSSWTEQAKNKALYLINIILKSEEKYERN
jgi:hypothetical protein